MTESKNTDLQKIGVHAEMGAYQEGIRQNNELLDRLKESREAVESEALRIIDATGIAFDQKNESIEAMRSWRKTIVTEATQATNAASALMKNLSAGRLSQLREFVDLMERLNRIDPGLIVGRLFSESNSAADKGAE